MKNIIAYLFLIGVLFASCGKSEVADPEPEDCETTMICEGDCLFTMHNVEGRVAFMNCYDTWSIFYFADSEDEYESVVLVVDMPEDYQEEGKAVLFSATFFENDIPLQLPDPIFFNRLHKVELCNLELQN